MHDIRELELAAIERRAGEGGKDVTVAIPESVLLRGGEKKEGDETEYPVVQAAELPIHVQVVAFPQ